MRGIVDGARCGRVELPDMAPEPPSTHATAQVMDLALDGKGRLWVGYSKGIAWLDKHDDWHRLRIEPPISLVQSFALADPQEPSEIWAAADCEMGSFACVNKPTIGRQRRLTLGMATVPPGRGSSGATRGDGSGGV